LKRKFGPGTHAAEGYVGKTKWATHGRKEKTHRKGKVVR